MVGFELQIDVVGINRSTTQLRLSYKMILPKMGIRFQVIFYLLHEIKTS